MTSLGAKQHFGKSATRTLPSPAAAEAFLEASGDRPPVSASLCHWIPQLPWLSSCVARRGCGRAI